MVGRFRTAPGDRRSVSFVWSGDTVGQGWGIDEARGGMLTYATMRRNRPDFFIHAGDTIYADVPLAARGEARRTATVWRNIVTEEKHKAAETLAEFRGNWKYNLLDRNLLAFNAEVPIAQPVGRSRGHQQLVAGGAAHPRRASRPQLCREERPALMARAATARCTNIADGRDRRASRAASIARSPYGPLLDVFMIDMRSYRGPNAENNEDDLRSGGVFPRPAQLAWLKRELIEFARHLEGDRRRHAARADRAYDAERKWGSEAIAQGDGPPRGRELEIADLLAFIKHAGIRNTVWLTADVHYTAAHYFDPDKAVFQDFEPFWEFVSGPIHAGTGPERHRQHVRAAGASTSRPDPEPAGSPPRACSSSAMWRSTAQPR